ncbi:MAG: MarR family transcriptional regulator [Thermaerobacter sp.]|nr:MarR family transcriptional regulator [Thermaerobacter sp.]
MRKGGFVVAKIHQLSGRIISHKFRQRGLKIHHAQGRILFFLWQCGGVSIQQLAVALSLDLSTLSLMLDRLAEAGLVHKVPSTVDKRKTMVFAADNQAELRAHYEQVLGEMQEGFYRGFSEEEVGLTEALLERIYRNLSSMDKENKEG